MDVLVTDGDQRSALAVTRSLGRKGVAVLVGEQHAGSLTSASRYCAREFVYPSPSREPSAFKQALIDAASRKEFRILIPMTDVTCTLVADIKADLEQHVKVALPDRDIFDKAVDKGKLVQLAQSIGVPVPETIFVNDIDLLPEIAKGLTYPVVLKPTRSRLLTDNGWVTGSVTYAYNPDELVEKFRAIHEKVPFPMIQERVDGPGAGLFLLFADGEPLAVFAHQRIREKPPSGGVSVYREAVEADEATVDSACKLLKALNWNGVAMVEFKIDRRDGSAKLMELNGRFWGSLQLAIDAGVDFPYLLYQVIEGKHPVKVADYHSGVKTRWLLGDLDHLLIIWTSRRQKLSLPEGHPGRLLTSWNFLKAFFEGGRLEIWNSDDMGPAFKELRGYISTTLKSIKDRLH